MRRRGREVEKVWSGFDEAFEYMECCQRVRGRNLGKREVKKCGEECWDEMWGRSR